MNHQSVAFLLKSESEKNDVCVKGWVRTVRDGKGFSFIELNDGSCLTNIQIVAPESLVNYTAVSSLPTGSSCAVYGDLVA